MHYFFIAISLFGFWLILSGHYTLLLLVFGVMSVLLVVYLLRRMDQIDEEPITLRPGLKFFHYIGWLLWQVVLANIDVARRIWHPSLPIQPTWAKLDIKVTKPLEKTLYANSITLTPGTLTADLEKDYFIIHSLTPEGIDELRQGEMQQRILNIGL
jgi:multicomponent Na+:H+ antiporter subunit E